MTIQIKMAWYLALASLTCAAIPAAAQNLKGAGFTFAAPLYRRWAQEYFTKTGVEINYYAIGSTGGIRKISDRSFDFGASDAPMTDAEMRIAPGVVHVPTVAGSVVIAYNLPGVATGLRLTGPVIADIFLGKINLWNDRRISTLNPRVSLPDLPILTAHRADGSGTTDIFTSYLSDVSASWQSTLGVGKSNPWPNGAGGIGNQQVAELIGDKPGGIGYIELTFAVQNKLTYAAVRNASASFVYPSVASTTAAAAGVTLPADFRKTITNTASATGYPIAGFTFILVYRDAKPSLKSFLLWALTDGQKDAPALDYAPLPADVQQKALAEVENLD